MLRHFTKFIKVAALLTLYTHSRTDKRALCSPQLNSLKQITKKDLNAYFLHPQYYQGTVILLNEEAIKYIPQHLPIKYHYCPEAQEDETLRQYDVIAVNNAKCLLLKFRDEEDYIKFMNFYNPLDVLRSKEQALNLLRQTQGKVVFTYLPTPKQSNKTFQEKSNDLEDFSRRNKKDIGLLEDQFKELRLIDYNRDVQYYIIRDEACAAQFRLSDNDIGEIYVLKESNVFNSKESAFVEQGKEFNLQKVEPDPNSELPDHFKRKEKQASLQATILKLIGLDLQARPVATQALEAHRVVHRITQLSTSYVNHVVNKQQMDSLIFQLKQLSTQYLLVCYSQEDEKLIKKLVNFKRGLNTQQQSQIQIILSSNTDLLREYFGIIANPKQAGIRLLDLHKKQPDNFTFRLQYLGEAKPRFYEKSIQDLVTCHRQIYEADKVTVNRLKEFVTQFTTLQLAQAKHMSKFSENPYYEQHNLLLPQTKLEVITANHLNLSGLDLVYFYKPGCNACYKLQDMLEHVVDDLKQPSYWVSNPSAFHRLQFKRYNIYNESLSFASPKFAPQIAVVKDGEVHRLDLKGSLELDPKRMIRLLTKFVDGL